MRKFAMGAALNGIALHGGLKAYGGTFLAFSDYMRGAIRLSAMMKLPVVYVFTHDSIAVGEDGPTHQPIEQIPSLRLVPELTLFRPADANETAEVWRFALQASNGPFALALSRQALPVLPGTERLARNGIARGAYILAAEPSNKPDVQIVATGSEVSLALAVRELLAEDGVAARVVSMPSRELFERQPEAYRHQVIDPAVRANVAIELAHPSGWEGIVGADGLVIGIRTFGASAKPGQLMREYGFTSEGIAGRILEHFFVSGA